MHPRNRHQNRYDFEALIKTVPELKPFIFTNEHGSETLDFSDPHAVRMLNKAILKSDYGIRFWELAEEFLCPPIPGRADYIHGAADLFSSHHDLHVLDIGTGASCIYPLLGVKEYNWRFAGSDINKKSLNHAQNIIEKNHLTKTIQLRLQPDKTKLFQNIILADEKFELSICNPPFHQSSEEASEGTRRKWRNLGKKSLREKLNFGGSESELWYPGGEKAFVSNMINESFLFKDQVHVFTTLISKEKNVMPLMKLLKSVNARGGVKEMEQGNKKSRFLYWSF
jgi:23S rRNA (adenine1618-N6)-methyltransferase